MTIELTDDGTMDTVLRCSECGEEMRFNYANSGADDANAETEYSAEDQQSHYDEWVAVCIEDVENDHDCPQSPENLANDERLKALGFDKGSRGCSQCQALSINGTPCHEKGCPNIPPIEPDYFDELIDWEESQEDE